MSQVKGQPELRFSKAGPNGIEGISYGAKRFYFKKADIAGTTTDDFFVAPAGVYISLAVMRVDTTVNNSGVVTLGTDGDADALIDATDFDPSAAGNWGSNLGSTTSAAATGLYLPAGDTLRLAITGTATTGAVSGFIEYYELDDMEDRGVHFDLT